MRETVADREESTRALANRDRLIEYRGEMERDWCLVNSAGGVWHMRGIIGQKRMVATAF